MEMRCGYLVLVELSQICMQFAIHYTELRSKMHNSWYLNISNLVKHRIISFNSATANNNILDFLVLLNYTIVILFRNQSNQNNYNHLAYSLMSLYMK